MSIVRLDNFFPCQANPGSDKLRATAVAGLCEGLNLPSAARRLKEAVDRTIPRFGDGKLHDGKTWLPSGNLTKRY